MVVDNRSNERSTSSAEAIRNLSRGEVLDAVRRYSPISRSRLVQEVPLSRATISSIVNEMLDLGLLSEAGLARSTGGRRPTLLEYHPEARTAVGVTMFGAQVTAVLTDLDGRPVERQERQWNGRSPESLVDVMIQTVQDVCALTDRGRVLGVGAGLPGVVDVARGTVVGAVSMGWNGDPVEARRLMEEAVGLPVIVVNRSRVAALGELRARADRDIRSLVYAFVGQGIVAGIVLDGEIYFGTSFAAGEIGHTTVVADGPLCGCGNHGCLETFASEGAIVARAIARAREVHDSTMHQATGGNLQLLTLEAIVKCARDGDAAALEVLEETGMYLGIALAGAVNILNPEMLVLGGPVGCSAGDLLLEPVVGELKRRTLSIPLAAVQVVAGSEETERAAIGAAVLVLESAHIEHIFSLGQPGALTPHH
jgi:N-acetylglucosamine repressor